MNIKFDSLGERLEFLLFFLNLTQADMARKTGIPKATISHIIRKKLKSYKDSVLLAERLGINHDWLIHGRGGILNPEVIYVPVIHDYFRLRLFQSEGTVEVTTQFIVTEQNYGDGVFATELNENILICSKPDESKDINQRGLGYLLWSERRKALIPELLQGKRIFMVHEIRKYESIPPFLLSRSFDEG